MNTIKTVLLLSLLGLASCAAPATKPLPPVAAAPADGVLECRDDSATGSNIRHHHCERVTEEMRRQRQAQINALQRPSGSNAGAAAGTP